MELSCDPPSAWQHGRQGGRIILSGGGAVLPRHFYSLFSWNFRGSEAYTELIIKSFQALPRSLRNEILSFPVLFWGIVCFLLRMCRNEKSRAPNLIFRQVERSAFNMQFSRGMIRRSSLKQHISLPFQVIHQYFTVIL